MKKHIFYLLPAFCAAIGMTACEEDMQKQDVQGESEIAVVARTDEDTDAQARTRSTNSTLSGTVITDAKVSLKEFELEVINLSATQNLLSELEIELKEPRVITLMAEGSAQAAVIAEGKLQNGLYKEAEFSFHKNLSVSASDEMYGKSVLIRGTYNSLPFVCWTDEENEVEIEFDGEGVSVEESGEIYVSFYLNRMMSEINFSLAVDGNANGVIEIGPDGIDGNAALYAALQASYKGMTEL